MFAAYRKEDENDAVNIPTEIASHSATEIPSSHPEWLQNTSFVPAAPPPEQVELSSESSPLDSDVEIVAERKRKKKKHKKLKNKKKETSPPKQEFDRRTVFIKPNRPGVLPHELFGDSRVPDRENIAYKEMYARQVAKYKLKRVSVCLDSGIAEVLFPKKAAERALRYFSRHRLAKLKPSVSGTMVKIAPTKPLAGAPSILPLPVTCRSDAGAFLWNPDTLTFDLKADDDLSEILDENTPAYNQRVTEDPHNVPLWLDYVRSVDSVPGLGTEKYVRQKATAILERKTAILDKAIGLNPSSLELYLEKIELGKDGLLDYTGLLQLWKDVEFKFPQRLQMWRCRIDFDRQTQLGRFSLQTLHQTYDRCVAKLFQITSGQLKTHKPEANTEAFVFKMLLERVDLLRETGFEEKSFAALQALIEFNFFHPSTLETGLSLAGKREMFELYWAASTQRFPMSNAVHWCQFIDSGVAPKSVFDLTETQYENIEKDILESGLDRRSKWITLERLRTSYFSTPFHGPEDAPEPADPDRIVTFDDVGPFLFQFSDHLKPWLLVKMAVALKIPLPPMVFCFIRDLQIEAALESITSANPAPDSDSIASNAIRDQFFSRAVSLLDQDEEWSFFLISMRLWSLRSEFKENWKGFRKAAKTILELPKCRSSCVPFCIYAECLASLKATAEMEKTLQATFSLLGNATLSHVGRVERLVLLNLLNTFAEAKLSGGKLEHVRNVIINTLSGNPFSSIALALDTSPNLDNDDVKSLLPKITLPTDASDEIDIVAAWLGTGLGSTATLALYASSTNLTALEQRFVEISKIALDARATVAPSLHCVIDAEFGAICAVFARLLARLRPRNLRQRLGEVLGNSPANLTILRIFCDLHTAGFLFADLRRTLMRLAEGDKTGIVTLALLSAEVGQLQKLEHQLEGFLTFHHGFDWIFDRLESVLGANPGFWNALLDFLTCHSRNRVEAELPRILSHCPYSKPLILKLVEWDTSDKWERHVDHLALNQMRIRIPLEELDLLIDSIAK